MKLYYIYFPESDDCSFYGYLTGFSKGGLPCTSCTNMFNGSEISYDEEQLDTVSALVLYFKSIGWKCTVKSIEKY